MYDKFKHELPYCLLDTSKYPPEVAGRFNSFITTQFDDSLSVEMQMRSIIKWAIDNFKEMDSEYNEFTDYIINKNINPFIEFLNDLIEYMNEFVDTFDTKFQDEILLNLQKWYDDGTLATIINESLDTKYHEMDDRLSAQLAQTKSELETKDNQITSRIDSIVAGLTGEEEFYTPIGLEEYMTTQGQEWKI